MTRRKVPETHVPIIDDFGGAPVAQHDMACAVCQTRPAVLELATGHFQPCSDCQSKGWYLLKRGGA